MAELRIASLLPAATEIVFALGLGEALVGVTHECDYPAEARTRPCLTRSLLPTGLSSAEIDAAVSAAQRDAHTIYDLDASLLARLEPDLVLTQSLCDVCALPRAAVEAAVCSMPASARVLSLDPSSLADVLADIQRVGGATESQGQASNLVRSLQERIEAVRRRAALAQTRPRVFCAEWLDPLFCAGHWLPEMVAIAGGEEALGRPFEDSVRLPWQDVIEYEPEVIVLMPCGFDPKTTVREAAVLAKRPGWSRLPAVQAGEVYVADAGSYFARPGPRLVNGLEMLARLLHPGLFQEPLPEGRLLKLTRGTINCFQSFR